MNLRKAAVVVGLAVFGSFGFQAVQAEDVVENLFAPAPDDYIQTRSYVGVLGTLTNIDNAGDFDGTLGFQMLLNSSTELDLIPGINRNFGFGGLAGYRTGAYAVELSYWRSQHQSYWSGGGPTTFFGVSTYQSFNFDLKRYFLTKYPAQPFVNFGLSFPWLVVEDASTLDGLSFDDASISGIGLNLGIGLEFYLGPDYSLLGSVNHRWSGFNQINGAAKQAGNVLTLTGDLSEQGNLAGDGLNFFVGATIGFQ